MKKFFLFILFMIGSALCTTGVFAMLHPPSTESGLDVALRVTGNISTIILGTLCAFLAMLMRDILSSHDREW